MLQLLYTACMFLAVSVRYLGHKPTLSLLAIYCLFCPRIELGSVNINISYVFVFLLAGLMLLREHDLYFSFDGYRLAKSFTVLSFYVYAVSIISWLIMSRIDPSTMIASVLGGVKNVILLLLICQMNSEFSKKTLEKEALIVVFVMLALNSIASVIQLSSVQAGMAIVTFRNDPLSNSFLNDVVQYGSFSRCFGVMTYPMMLGILSVVSFVLLTHAEDCGRVKKLAGLMAIAFCAVCSASKTAWLGIAAALVLYAFCAFHFGKDLRKSVLYFGAIGVLFAGVVVFYDAIGVFIAENFGANYAWYWSFLRDIGDVFSTRYSSSEATALSYMPSFLSQYWAIGVGPSSIAGELAIDSAFYIILHNGGVVALCPVVLFYVFLLKRYWDNKEFCCFSLVVCMLLMGFGFQTWLTVEINAWVFAYLFMQSKQVKRFGPYKSKLRSSIGPSGYK